MNEKELRLALVCFGGISLAVYMHGITKEVLKLARASRTYHASPDASAHRDARYAELAEAGPDTDTIDTEAVYFELLKRIGERLRLRVIVDVVSGASAGGVNGVLLARALAHDLRFDPLREMWLEKADVEELLAPERRAAGHSKWFMRPLLWWFNRSPFARLTPDEEMRRKLSLFVRSRWFRPPFSGHSLSTFLLDAMTAMQPDGERRSHSLLPSQQPLDLFVTVTDYYGYAQRIRLHDPAFIQEREHRHVFRFRHGRTGQPGNGSELGDDWVPALSFAARATSSFPGAFPPARLAEFDRLLDERGQDWPSRANFVGRGFTPYLRGGLKAEDAVFIDGSVLNNMPFAEAITAIQDRPAYRQVDRRLIYIDPDPEQRRELAVRRTPGFFNTLKGALSDIPRNEPIRDELAWVEGFNERIRRLKSALEGARPRVNRLVDKIAGRALNRRPSLAQIHRWREAANELAAAEAGFAYEGYLRLKIDAVIEQLCQLVLEAQNGRPDALERSRVNVALTAWAQRHGVYPEWSDERDTARRATSRSESRWADFLIRFDHEYRSRRLRFVIRELNTLYVRLEEPEFEGLTPQRLDEVKEALYNALELLQTSRNPDFLAPDVRETLAHFDWEAEALEQVLGPTLDRIAADIDLRSFNDAVDRIFGVLVAELPRAPRRVLLVAYLGFAFWDVLAFTMTSWRSLGEYDEIRVDRISPEDANSLREGGAAATLKGIGLEHFAAFFSRTHRENDYLWGRLHAAERLIDIVCDAAGAEHAGLLAEAKRDAFIAVLHAERGNLPRCDALIDALLRELGAATPVQPAPAAPSTGPGADDLVGQPAGS